MIRNPPHRFGQGDTRRIIMISWQTELGHPGKTGSLPFWVDKTPPKTQTPTILMVERKVLFQRFWGSMIHVSFRKCCVFFSMFVFDDFNFLIVCPEKTRARWFLQLAVHDFYRSKKSRCSGCFESHLPNPSILVLGCVTKFVETILDPKGTYSDIKPLGWNRGFFLVSLPRCKSGTTIGDPPNKKPSRSETHDAIALPNYKHGYSTYPLT